jgi:hypothetical protein
VRLCILIAGAVVCFITWAVAEILRACCCFDQPMHLPFVLLSCACVVHATIACREQQPQDALQQRQQALTMLVSQAVKALVPSDASKAGTPPATTAREAAGRAAKRARAQQVKLETAGYLPGSK